MAISLENLYVDQYKGFKDWQRLADKKGDAGASLTRNKQTEVGEGNPVLKPAT